MDNPQDIHSGFLEELATWLRRKIYVVIGGLGVFLMLSAVVLNYIKDTRQQSNPETGEVFTQSLKNQKVKVDIEGAVEEPGIYELANDSRIQDVLITAGGLTAKANRSYVSKNINLAQKVYDGQKIFVPEENASISNLGNLSNLSHLININTASLSELDSLPGIGLATARKIITSRPYQNTSDLVGNHIVSQSVYLKIKDLISL